MWYLPNPAIPLSFPLGFQPFEPADERSAPIILRHNHLSGWKLGNAQIPILIHHARLRTCATKGSTRLNQLRYPFFSGRMSDSSLFSISSLAVSNSLISVKGGILREGVELMKSLSSRFFLKRKPPILEKSSIPIKKSKED